MDASELDADVKLYKASEELLNELQVKLPLLLKTPSGQSRKWVFVNKVEEVTKLLDRFQEWPQLLDPHLAVISQELVTSYLIYCTSSSAAYLQDDGHESQIIPLPRAVARILYALCKVRGQKVIVRLLNNEPRYVEPLLSCFRMWGYSSPGDESQSYKLMTWEERYIMLLWLSHLMLAPFELSSISVLAAGSSQKRTEENGFGLPPVAQNLLSLALDHLDVSSKAREAASVLAVRLALRGDMQVLNLPANLVRWAVSQLRAASTNSTTSSYQYIGLLELLFGMTNLASDNESGAFLEPLLATIHQIANSENLHFAIIRDQAPARKLMVKTMRASIMHAISLSEVWLMNHSTLDVNQYLEGTIQTFLEYLGDKDTPVRQAASKSLGIIALKLDPDMAAEVIEAVLGTLNENMLLEDVKTGQLVALTDRSIDDVDGFKKNVNAVDPLKWHGAVLTLGHLLFRRSPPTTQLHSIIEALLMGLEFEQRSNVGTSIGVGVRDAACFGIWSLARKYSTDELSNIKFTTPLSSNDGNLHSDVLRSTIQLIATKLIVSACLDPSGNLRRGSSAALQELIGRHPDVIPAGIPVVQVVDYHAVARRSRAMDEVAAAVSGLDLVYHDALQYALLQWRGARATDADSRRHAADTVGELYGSMPQQYKLRYVRAIVTQIIELRTSNIGSNAAARHGLVLSLASLLQSDIRSLDHDRLALDLKALSPLMNDLSLLTGSIAGRITSDIENVLEAVAGFISAVTTVIKHVTNAKFAHEFELDPRTWAIKAIGILDRCTLASDKDTVTQSAAKANVSILALLPNPREIIRTWFNLNTNKRNDLVCRGRIDTAAAVLENLANDDQWLKDMNDLKDEIISYLCDFIDNITYTIETKVNAMQSIRRVLELSATLEDGQLKRLATAVEIGLSDYTVDQRGDIGSSLRLASIEAVEILARRRLDPVILPPITQTIVKLAAEKLAKVRFNAYLCLMHMLLESRSNTKIRLFEEQNGFLISLQGVEHQADVSSIAYYSTLLQFLKFQDYQGKLLLGFISSVATGTEDISRACSEALVTTMLEEPDAHRPAIFHSVMSFTSHHLQTIVNQEDRFVVPCIDFLALLLEQVYLTLNDALRALSNASTLWSIIQKVHNPASSLTRLEALIRLYSAMITIDDFQLTVLDRLTRMLLHKWPKIRSAAAATIYLYSQEPSILYTDWHATAISNRNKVVELRTALGITSEAVSSARATSSA